MTPSVNSLFYFSSFIPLVLPESYAYYILDTLRKASRDAFYFQPSHINSASFIIQQNLFFSSRLIDTIFMPRPHTIAFAADRKKMEIFSGKTRIAVPLPLVVIFSATSRTSATKIDKIDQWYEEDNEAMLSNLSNNHKNSILLHWHIYGISQVEITTLGSYYSYSGFQNWDLLSGISSSRGLNFPDTSQISFIICVLSWYYLYSGRLLLTGFSSRGISFSESSTQVHCSKTWLFNLELFPKRDI